METSQGNEQWMILQRQVCRSIAVIGFLSMVFCPKLSLEENKETVLRILPFKLLVTLKKAHAYYKLS